MKQREERWGVAEGATLHASWWETEGTPKGAVALVHGLGEHSGRYGELVGRLTDAGYAVVAVDLRGHGRSTGKRGHTLVEDCLCDIDRLLDEAAHRFPGLPRFLYGHSFGGLLVLSHLLRRRPAVAGAVVTGPALHTDLRTQKVKVALTRVLGRFLPTMTVPSGVKPDLVSRQPDVVAAYRADPLVHDRVSLGFGRQALAAIDHTLAHAGELSTPLLVLHGGADRLTFPSGSQALALQAGGDCTLRILDGQYHELHHEPEAERLFDEIVVWLDAHRG
ncbi:MAG TPA: alpha/beta hydrolase [Acidimicrobiia bacterium]